MTDNGDGTLTFVDETGTPETISIDLETLTVLTALVKGNPIATYTDEDGANVDIFETITSLVDNGDGTYDFTNEDGVTVTITDTDTDTLAGLTCAAGEYVTWDGAAWVCSAAPSTDDQQLKISGGTIAIEDGNSVTFPVETIYVETFAAGSANGTTQAWARDATITRFGTGHWRVAFGFAHPDGVDYAVSIVTEEGTLRDTPLWYVDEGTKTANGFDLSIVTGDNGRAADIFVDAPFTFSVAAPIDVLTPAP